MADNSLIAELLRGQGAIMERLDALEKLICADEEEDKMEDKMEGSGNEDGPQLATNPAMHSNQLEMYDIPPIF